MMGLGIQLASGGAAGAVTPTARAELFLSRPPLPLHDPYTARPAHLALPSLLTLPRRRLAKRRLVWVLWLFPCLFPLFPEAPSCDGQVSKTCIAPMERVKIILQTGKAAVREC